MTEHIAAVRRYYESNTGLFERFGQAGKLLTIRRAIWGTGVTHRSQAFHYVDGLVASELRSLGSEFARPLRVFDFGSGCGASLLWLARTEPTFHGIGISLSRRQTTTGNALIAAARLSARLRCLEASFLDLPDTLAPGQLVYAIESSVHSPSLGAFFEAAARCLVPGGKLVICDDFVCERSTPLTPVQSRMIEDFQYGWLAPALATHAAAERAANAAGFVQLSNRDLTPLLELDRFRDRVVRALVPIARRISPLRRHDFVRSLIGGDALQRALSSGVMEHRFVVFRRL